ncbi:MAG TPA: hypothetical protein VF041_15220 [Gemmatimonadaceae bacterium]
MRALLDVSRRRAGLALACAAAVLGCGTESATVAAPVDPSRLLSALVLDHHAVVLSTTAPWNTIQLTATPTNPAGETLAGLASPTYTLSDTGSITISPDGVLTAVSPVTGVRVIASVTDGNVTRKDTAYVDVTDVSSPPVLSSFSIQPVAGDSAKLAAADFFQFFGRKVITPQATDDQGAPIFGLPAYFTTSDHSIATVDPSTGLVFAIRPGTVVIRASTTGYGVSMSDSLVLTITPPLLGLVFPAERTPPGSTTSVLVFDPPTLVVSAGATVLFANGSFDKSIDVVFDDSANVMESPIIPEGSGNIPPFHADSLNTFPYVSRAFMAPGTYTYHSTLFDTHGTIVVQ